MTKSPLGRRASDRSVRRAVAGDGLRRPTGQPGRDAHQPGGPDRNPSAGAADRTHQSESMRSHRPWRRLEVGTTPPIHGDALDRILRPAGCSRTGSRPPSAFDPWQLSNAAPMTVSDLLAAFSSDCSTLVHLVLRPRQPRASLVTPAGKGTAFTRSSPMVPGFGSAIHRGTSRGLRLHRTRPAGGRRRAIGCAPAGGAVWRGEGSPPPATGWRTPELSHETPA